MGPVCAVWVHILCLTIHFLAVQIWYFNVTKKQNRTSRLSWKVGGVKNVSDLGTTFFQRFIYIGPDISCQKDSWYEFFAKKFQLFRKIFFSIDPKKNKNNFFEKSKKAIIKKNRKSLPKL